MVVEIIGITSKVAFELTIPLKKKKKTAMKIDIYES